MFKKLKDICPFMGKPCIKDDCHLYMVAEKKVNDEIKKNGACAIVQSALFNFDQIHQSKNIQASVESLRNETVKSHKDVLNVSNVMRLKNKEKQSLEGDNG